MTTTASFSLSRKPFPPTVLPQDKGGYILNFVIINKVAPMVVDRQDGRGSRNTVFRSQ